MLKGCQLRETPAPVALSTDLRLHNKRSCGDGSIDNTDDASLALSAILSPSRASFDLLISLTGCGHQPTLQHANRPSHYFAQ